MIEAWGFAYKTIGFYWVKLNKSAAARLSREWPLLGERDFFTGLGFWTQGQPGPVCSRPAATPSATRAMCQSC